MKTSLPDLARRWKALDEGIRSLNRQITAIVTATAPDPVELHGVGVEIAGQFLVTPRRQRRPHPQRGCSSPSSAGSRPSQSGRTSGRHRLSRGGDRAANSALYIVTIVRPNETSPATSDYVERRTAEGLSKREIIRCLTRYIAREAFNNLLRTTLVEPTLEVAHATA